MIRRSAAPMLMPSGRRLLCDDGAVFRAPRSEVQVLFDTLPDCVYN